MKYVLLAHLAATLFMAGVIWFVQVVHYPLFAKVGGEKFALYSGAHSRLTSYVEIFWRRIAGSGRQKL